MKYITSAQNEQLKQLAKLLTSAKARRQEQRFAMEGVHLLDAFLNAQPNAQVIEQIFIPENRLQHPEIQAQIQRVSSEKITLVSNAALNKINSLTEGVDIISVLAMPSADGKNLPTEHTCVVLERVQDPGNVGTILRSAAAAGVRDVILSKDCVDAYSPKVLRAGMGAHFLLNIHQDSDLNAWRAAYRSPVLATALGEHKQRSLYDLDLSGECAWLLGNEGSGISTELLQQADFLVKIPMLGQTESLNVAMAATVCLFEQMRQKIHQKSSI